MSTCELLRLEGLPAYQNKMFASESAARSCPRGDLVLVQHESSGLVFNHAFDPEKIHYDDSYQNEQGHSPAFRTHVAQVLDLVGRHFSGLSILEIGCGKGAFLELMLAAGHAARGIDPAYEGDSENIIRRHFEPGLGIRGDAIVMRHVLEHIPSPSDFLASLHMANGGRGLIYIEVPCLDWILRNKAWFDVFYEHVNYFRLDDFSRMFDRLLESGALFGGQYIYVIAELDSLRHPATAAAAIRPATVPIDFFASLDRCAQIARNPASCAVWGAAAKGVMFAHHMQARGAELRLAIDINPAKQRHFLGGSGLQVLPAGEALAQLGSEPTVFVMNSNYLSEIQTMAGPAPNYVAVDQT
ncbi:MAG: class I SAM-dependent methyltransferase [Dokdonella sp.]